MCYTKCAMTKDLELLTRIASLYYEHEVNQNEIAEITQIERSRVSRLLLKARKEGLVQFHVVDPFKSDNALNDRLVQKFALEQAIVFDTLPSLDHQLKKTIGLVASKYLNNILKDGDVFGVSWGETIYHTIENLNPEYFRNIVVVPTIGGSGLLSSAYQINEIIRIAALKLGGLGKVIYAPAFMESKDAHDAILQTKDIKAIADLWNEVTVALVGIGKSPFDYRNRPETGLQFGQFYLFANEESELRKKGVAGDINARFFDSTGSELDVSVHERIIGMPLSELDNAPRVIAVAGGLSKVNAIHAALIGKHLNVLITDSITANKLLDFDDFLD